MAFIILIYNGEYCWNKLVLFVIKNIGQMSGQKFLFLRTISKSPIKDIISRAQISSLPQDAFTDVYIVEIYNLKNEILIWNIPS